MRPPPIPPYLPDEFILALKVYAEEKQREADEAAARYAASKVLKRPDFDPDKVTATAANPSTPPAQVSLRLRRGRPRTVPPPLPVPQIRKRGGWREAILHVLDAAAGGLPHQEVVRVARQQFELAPSNEEKAFYNALSKLVSAGAVVKYGNLLFSEKTMAAAKAGGSLPPLPAVARRAGSSAELVLSILRDHPDGLTGPQLREALHHVPSAPKSLYEHGHYIYNVLSPLMGTGEVIKSDDGVYRVAGAREENP